MTGIPPHVSMMAELNAMKEKFNDLRNNIKSDFKEALDTRGVGDLSFIQIES